MLKAEINQEEITLEVSGNIIDIMSDVAMLLVGIYRNLPDERTKKSFNRMLKDVVNEEVYTKTPEQLMENIEKKIDKDFMDFLKSIKGD